MQVEVVWHNDSTDQTQPLLSSLASAVVTPWNHRTFENLKLVRTSIDVLYVWEEGREGEREGEREGGRRERETERERERKREGGRDIKERSYTIT